MKKHIFNKMIGLAFSIVALLSCSNFSSFSAPTNENLGSISDNPDVWQANTATLWSRLQHTSALKLANLNTKMDNEQDAWLKLALISKQFSRQSDALITQLMAWRNLHPNHPGNTLFPENNVLLEIKASINTPHHIALLLPLHGPYADSGKAVKEGFLQAYYQNHTPSSIAFYDTTQQDAGVLYQKAVQEGATIVIGPLDKTAVQQVANLGALPIPTIALNYTNPGFSGLSRNLYEYGLLPEDDVNQIAERARGAHLSKAIIIASSSTFSKRLAATFSARWQALGGSISDTWYHNQKNDFTNDVAQLMKVDISTDKKLMKKANNKTILSQQRRQDFDVIFIFSEAREANIIVPLLRFYYATNIPIYATAHVYPEKTTFTKNIDLNGVIVCDIPWSINQLKHPSTDNIQSNRLYAVGQDAYLLSTELTRLIKIPDFPLYGATGALTISKEQQIHRRLPCTAI